MWIQGLSLVSLLLLFWVAVEIGTRNDGYDFSRIDLALEEMVQQEGVPGASMIVLKDGAVIYDRSLGEVDGQTTVTIGSASKWVTAAAIMTLWDEGKFELERPVHEVLPSFGETPAKREITLRHTLSHMTGLAAKHTCLRRYNRTLRACVDLVGVSPLFFEPGTKFAYGSLSMHVSAAVAEVTGEAPFRDLVKNRITDPLGMEQTHFGRFGHSPNPGVSGNLTTTRDDFVRFLSMLLGEGEFDGVRVLSTSAVRTMEAGHTGANTPRLMHVPERHVSSTHDIYGLGVWRDVVDIEDRLLVSSSPGKFGFTPWIDRRHGLVGVLSTEYPNQVAEQTHPPDPAGVMGLVCSVVDLVDNGPSDQIPNPRCRLRGVSEWK